MTFPRTSGILLHPTSLPGRFGIGDLGEEAYRFADFLAAGGQSLWQMLPLTPTGYGGSPYAGYSAFAGNALLISPESLCEEGLLAKSDLSEIPSLPPGRVDFERVTQAKDLVLKKSYERFQLTNGDALRNGFEKFTAESASWLDDYALFCALKDAHGGRPWHEWESRLAQRETAALVRSREQFRDQIEAQKFFQFLFFKQWFALKNYCHERGLKIIGDIPIFVAHDSADVWTHPEQFKLENNGTPTVVAGVPPDYFSATGQFWGNPLYHWERMRADGFKWWIERVRTAFDVLDIARIDHFRGFSACWEIPAGDKTAERGRWVETPGRELFAAIRDALGELPIIAEDLGVITPEVVSLRDDFGFPGMRILQFAFSSDASNNDLPHNYRHNVAAYTGTHDNDTAVGWFQSDAGENSTRTSLDIEHERKFCLNYLNTEGEEIHWDFIRAVLSSVADTAIVPLQDLLGLDTEARMNLPNSSEGNWTWRCDGALLTPVIADRLRGLTETYGRISAH